MIRAPLTLSRILVSATAFIIFSGLPLAVVFAQGTRGGGLGDVPQNGGCTTTADCQQNGTPLTCFPTGNGACQPSSLVTQNDVPPGGGCTNDNQCEDVGNQQYGCYPEGNGTCTLNGNPPTANQTAPAGANQTAPAGNNQTGIPGANQSGSGNPAVNQGNASDNNSLNGPGGTSGTPGGALLNPLKATSLQQLLQDVLTDFVLPLGGIFLTVMLVYVGFLFAAAQGNSERIGQARSALLWVIVGGLLLLGASALSIVITSTVTSLGS